MRFTKIEEYDYDINLNLLFIFGMNLVFDILGEVGVELKTLPKKPLVNLKPKLI